MKEQKRNYEIINSHNVTVYNGYGDLTDARNQLFAWKNDFPNEIFFIFPLEYWFDEFDKEKKITSINNIIKKLEYLLEKYKLAASTANSENVKGLYVSLIQDTEGRLENLNIKLEELIS